MPSAPRLDAPRSQPPCSASPSTARAAQTPAAAAAQAKAATNAAPAEPEPPKSVFVNPATPQEGRDPFFPQSTRRIKTTAVGHHRPPSPGRLSRSWNSRESPVRLTTAWPSSTTAPSKSVKRARWPATSAASASSARKSGDDSVRVLLNGQERTLTLRGTSPTIKSGP